MKPHWFLLVLIVVVAMIHLAPPAHAQQSLRCSQFNYNDTNYPNYSYGYEQHYKPSSTSNHLAQLQGDVWAYYEGTVVGQVCKVTCSAEGQTHSYITDRGWISVYEHLPVIQSKDGTASGLSPQTVSEVTVAAIKACSIPGCTMGINIGFPPATWTFSPPQTPLFQFEQTATFTCDKEIGAVCQQPDDTTCDLHQVWSTAYCQCVTQEGGSPILIDTQNTGFRLGPPKVKFDLRGDGKKESWSWPEPGSGNGWLVYPGRTNHDGMVDSGKDMFGNFTDQPHHRCLNAKDDRCQQLNGYKALAVFKQPELGGYIDPEKPDTAYVLSERDKVWKELRIWIDENGDGISQPDELHQPSEFGIHSISLIPAIYKKTDEWGNQFMFGAPLNVDAKEVRDWADKNDSRLQDVIPHELDVQTYDVWLVNK